LRNAYNSLKAGAKEAGENTGLAAMLAAAGVCGMYIEGAIAVKEAKKGKYGKSAGHVACIPARFAIGLTTACATAAVGAMAIPAAGLTAVAQAALLAKDAWKRNKEPQEGEVRRQRRVNNVLTASSFSNRLMRMNRGFYEKFVDPSTDYAMGAMPLVPKSVQKMKSKVRPISE
jgi:hypothetical protein